MEAKTCCAYNATKGCKINSTVTVADSAREPLKILKVLVEGLARDSKSSLWLTPLVYAPQLTRIFPFDLAYLDKDMKVLEAIALQPETPSPRFKAGIASALILPFNSLQSSGTVPGDQIIVCTEEELALRIGETSRPVVAEAVAPVAEAPIAAKSIPFTQLPKLPMHPFPSPQVSAHTVAASTPHGSFFTGGMTTSWQISNSTTASAAVIEPVEMQEEVVAEEAIQEEEAANEKGAEIGLAETEAREERVESGSMPEPIPEPGVVSELVSDTAIPGESAESALEEPAPAAWATAIAESEVVAVEQEAVAVKSVAIEPVAPVEKPVAVAGSDRAEKPRADVSPVVSTTARVVEQAAVKTGAAESGTDAHPLKRKKPAESVPAKIARSSDADPITAKKKESLGVLVKRFLNCEDPPPERRSIIRLLVQGLIACTGDGENKKPCEVRDVSPTGLYLRTLERWKPGDVVSLVLLRKDATEEQREKRVTVELKAIRCDEGGVGFSWMWPEGVEFEPWKRVHTKRSDETDADFFLRELRLTRALAFLRQICPAAMEEMKLGLHKRLSNKRVASAVEIMLKAQELLGRIERRAKVQAHPDMVRRILENGSWTEDEWIRQWWGGLLVSSCSSGAPDTSNSVFIDLLAKLTPVHLRLLGFVCHRANEQIEAGEPAAKLELYCTSEELIEAVGSQSIARIQQTMGQLSSLALLAESNKPSYVAVTDKVKTRATPTALGLKMHARCHGRQ